MLLNGDKDTLPQLDQLESDIIKHLRSEKQITRNQLANHFSVSRSKITQIISQFLESRLLTEVEVGESSGGRRPTLLTLNPEFGYVVGISMGATGVSICLANFCGDVIGKHRHTISVSHQKPDDIMEGIFYHIHRMLNDCHLPKEKVLAIGIGVPAPIDQNNKVIVNPATLIGWENYSIKDYCHKHFFQLPVIVENDTNIMALGEYCAGMAQEHNNFIFVKVGTGIGCGIIINGKIYQGTTGYGGHIGHVSIDLNGPFCHCGNIGCLEKFASGPAIVESATKAAHNHESQILLELLQNNGGQLSPEDVGNAAVGRADKVANKIITEAGTAIGKVLANIVSFFNPSLVLIGGGVSNIGPQFVLAIHQAILNYAMPLVTQNLDIYKSEMGHDAGLHGAVALALDNIFQVS